MNSTCVFQVHPIICCLFFLCPSSRFPLLHLTNSNSMSFQTSRWSHASGRCLAIHYLVSFLFSEQGESHYLHGNFMFLSLYFMPINQPWAPKGRTRLHSSLTMCGFNQKNDLSPNFMISDPVVIIFTKLDCGEDWIRKHSALAKQILVPIFISPCLPFPLFLSLRSH